MVVVVREGDGRDGLPPRQWDTHAPSDFAGGVAAVDFCTQWLDEHGEEEGSALVLSPYRSVVSEASAYIKHVARDWREDTALGGRAAAAERVRATTLNGCLGADVQVVAVVLAGAAERHWGFLPRPMVVGITRASRCVAFVANDPEGNAVVPPEGLGALLTRARDAAEQGVRDAERDTEAPVHGGVNALFRAERVARTLQSVARHQTVVRSSPRDEDGIPPNAVRETFGRAAAARRTQRAPVCAEAVPDAAAVLQALKQSFRGPVAEYVEAAGESVKQSARYATVARREGAFVETAACAALGWAGPGRNLPQLNDGVEIPRMFGGVYARGPAVVELRRAGVAAAVFGQCGAKGPAGLAASIAFGTACALRWRTCVGESKPLATKSAVRWEDSARATVSFRGQRFGEARVEGTAAVGLQVPAVVPRPEGRPHEEPHVRLLVSVEVGRPGARGVRVVSISVGLARADGAEEGPGELFWERIGNALRRSHLALRDARYTRCERAALRGLRGRTGASGANPFHIR